MELEIQKELITGESEDDVLSQYLGSDYADGRHKFLTVTEQQEETIPKSVGVPSKEQSGQDVFNPNISTEVQALTLVLGNLMTNNVGKMEQLMARQTAVRLPKFSGNPLEWPSFISQWNISNQECGFSLQMQYYRLLESLTGDELKGVRALLIGTRDVDRTIKLLHERYGRDEIIVKYVIERARNVIPPREDKPETLVEYSDAIQNLVNVLDTLEQEDHLRNPLWLEELVSKLPISLKYKWTESHVIGAKGKVTLRDLSLWAANLGEIGSYMKLHTFSESKEETKKHRQDRVFSVVEETVPLAEKEVLIESKSVTCFSCKQAGHRVRECKIFFEMSPEDRNTLVSRERLCICCLRPGHRGIDCRARRRCVVDGCKRWHHSLLHNHKPVQENSGFVTQDASESVTGITHSMQLQTTQNRVLLSILPVTIWGPKAKLSTFALLDSGSTVTLLDESAAIQLGLNGPRDQLSLQWTNSVTRRDSGSRRVSVTIAGAEGQQFLLENVRTVKDLSLPVQSIDMNKFKEKWKHLEGKIVPSLSNAQPLILIGQDNCDLTLAREVIQGPKNAPILTRTRLGWVVQGPTSHYKGRTDVTLHMYSVSEEQEQLHELVKRSFALDSIGIKALDKEPRSKEDVKAEKQMEACTKRVCERWETGLLWKHDDIILPSSKTQAMNRLYALERKLDKNDELLKRYCTKIEDYQQKGYVTKLNTEQASMEGPRTWYLPHFPVINPNKPGKIRLVFDAAVKNNGISLNDALVTGPDFLNSLLTVLLKFRLGRIGFVADIKEMFHQIKIREGDLQAQRFLWRGETRNQKPDVMQLNVMIFGIKCSPSSALYTMNRNAEEFKDTFPRATKAIVERHYMDDYLDSTDSEQDASLLIKEVTEIHRNGGFTICNWLCNSTQVLSEIPPDLRMDNGNVSTPIADDSVERVLGLYWKPKSDEFTFLKNFQKINPEIVCGTKVPTKRDVLKLVMSVFDPLGIVAHFTIKAKIILQDIWRSGIGWDDELTSELSIKWDVWISELNEVSSVSVPRCYSVHLPEATSVQLHIFCDASESAFAVVAFLRIKCKEHIEVAYVASKSRVSPLRPVSIPRLELQAALMGSRLLKTIREAEIPFHEEFLWTDSKTVLCWIRSDSKRYKSYVAQRVGEISELTDVNSWKWVPTNLNVADDATRNGKTDFSPASRWWRGPDFLSRDNGEWPQEKRPVNETEIEEDVKPEFVHVVSVNSHLPDISRFSSFTRLVRSTAWVLRFIEICKLRRQSKSFQFPISLTPDEVAAAEKVWWKAVQEEYYHKEILDHIEGRQVKSSSSLNNLSLVYEDGILRLKSRAELFLGYGTEARYPVILPRRHPFTILLVHHVHKKAGHHGRELIANELRQRYHIQNLRSLVKSSWTTCQWCKIKRSKPNPPEMAPLPECRLTPYVRPFNLTGMDYFGPMYVTVGRRHEKRYGVLFTCMSTRAIHLEVASSLSTDSCILAIRRMAGRRGTPKEIFSDNGTNLKGADTELKKAMSELQSQVMQDDMSGRGIRWHFSPPAAPHMGGSWERLVKSVKLALAVTLKERYPKEEVLQTLLVEAENIVNSRPLTHVSVDPDDMDALTPNHFLIGSSSSYTAMGLFTDTDLCLRKQWKIAQRLADLFWKRWIHEYMPTLTRRVKWNIRTEPVKVGDLVIIVDEQLQRNCWPRGVVSATHPGKDGQVRVADVRTTSGEYRRPVTKLCVLDVGGMVGVGPQIPNTRGENVPAWERKNN